MNSPAELIQSIYKILFQPLRTVTPQALKGSAMSVHVTLWRCISNIISKHSSIDLSLLFERTGGFSDYFGYKNCIMYNILHSLAELVKNFCPISCPELFSACFITHHAVVTSHLELFEFPRCCSFFLPFLYKFLFFNDDFMVLTSLQDIDTLMNAFGVRQVGFYHDHCFHELLKQGLLHRLYYLISQHLTDNEWLVAIFNVLGILPYSRSGAMEFISEFNFYPTFLTILKSNTSNSLVSSLVYELISKCEVLSLKYESGITSYVCEIMLSRRTRDISSFAFDILDCLATPLWYYGAAISEPRPPRCHDLQNHQQRVTTVLRNVRYTKITSEDEATILIMINDKSL
jgi:hypothetical protein